MLMATKRRFLNFEVSEEFLVKLDDAATRSRWDRSKQARWMLEKALGIEPKPYWPMQEPVPFSEPAHDASGTKSRRRRRAA